MRGHRYAAYYCEENIWHLCQEPRFEGVEGVVVVISNPWRSCALWHQRAASGPEVPVVWDYHVVMIAEADRGWEVWDMDTLLGMPVPFERWFEGTFLGVGALRARFRSSFRVVEASEYVRTLSTDRGHMVGEGGRYMQAPPEWARIVQGPVNLMRFVDVGAGFVGEVLEEAPFFERFSGAVAHF